MPQPPAPQPQKVYALSSEDSAVAIALMYGLPAILPADGPRGVAGAGGPGNCGLERHRYRLANAGNNEADVLPVPEMAPGNS